MEPKVLLVFSASVSPYGYIKTMTPATHTPNPISSCLVTSSPRNKNAIMVANMGEVLLIKESLDKDIN